MTPLIPHLGISFVVATLGWMVVAELLGPPLGRWIYRLRVTGLRFASEEQAKAWALDATVSSRQVALILLAVAFGAIAGLFKFPLIGFTRSFDAWGWFLVCLLCGISWLVAYAARGM